MSHLFLLNAGLFPFSLSEISEILVSPSICTKIRIWRFHRTEEVSNNFSVSWHITHISMAISANLGRDTDHNSTKLVCAHPLIEIQKRNPRWWRLRSLLKWAIWEETCNDHRGFRFVFRWPFRVSSSRERAVKSWEDLTNTEHRRHHDQRKARQENKTQNGSKEALPPSHPTCLFLLPFDPSSSPPPRRAIHN